MEISVLLNIYHHDSCLKIAKEIVDQAREVMAYGNLGIAYQSLGDDRKAINEYHERDLNFTKDIGVPGRRNLGNAYRSLGDYEKATEYHEKYFKIAKQIGDGTEEGIDCGNLGTAYHAVIG